MREKQIGYLILYKGSFGLSLITIDCITDVMVECGADG